MKERIVKTFIDLVEIDSESKNEGKVHAYLESKFKSLGLEVKQDNSMEVTKLGANNLVATLHGSKQVPAILFSCHSDTVVPGVGIKVEEKEGVLYSVGDTILGADDKAGIAVMLETIERLQEEGIETGPIEFVIHPGEEIGLIGSSHMDMSLVNAKLGYVLDSAGRIGNVTVGSPSLYMYEVNIKGKPAHAGLEPEKGISCVSIMQDALNQLPLGRIDAETTANIGVIQGGQVTNIVMESMVIKGEVRAIDDATATRLVEEAQHAFEEAAKKHGGTVVFTKDKKATGFKIEDDQVVMQKLYEAGKGIDLEIITEVSGGGSDANIFNANGIRVVNLSVGYDKIHTTEENIEIQKLEDTVELVLAIIKAHAK